MVSVETQTSEQAQHGGGAHPSGIPHHVSLSLGFTTSFMAGLLLQPRSEDKGPVAGQWLRVNHLVSKVSPTDESMETRGGPSPVLYG